MLFKAHIDGWGSWGRVFASREAFAPLIGEILAREGLSSGAPIQGLTPGTNAVFRAGAYVVKAFAPIESGLDTLHDYKTELAAMAHARENGVATPEVCACGEIDDKYLFRYIVMRYIDAPEARDVFPAYDRAQRRTLGMAVRELLKRLNTPPRPGLIAPIDVKRRAVENERLKGLPAALVEGLRETAMAQDMSGSVLVHGDATGDNVLILPSGQPLLIDFADSCIAPPDYELPPVVFDLLRLDRDAVHAFSAGEDPEAFMDRLIAGLSLHDFGGGIVKSLLADGALEERDVQSLDALRGALCDRLFRGLRPRAPA